MSAEEDLQRQIEAMRPVVEKWERIQAAWLQYCRDGAGAFDWDYDSRYLMRELVDDPGTQPPAPQRQ